jgi:transcriptional regulator with XRE-family HTH domain
VSSLCKWSLESGKGSLKTSQKADVLQQMKNIIGPLRRRAGITQRELAEKLGVSRSTVSRWECTGDVTFKYIDTLMQAIGGHLRFSLVYVGPEVAADMEVCSCCTKEFCLVRDKIVSSLKGFSIVAENEPPPKDCELRLEQVLQRKGGHEGLQDS